MSDRKRPRPATDNEDESNQSSEESNLDTNNTSTTMLNHKLLAMTNVSTFHFPPPPPSDDDDRNRPEPIDPNLSLASVGGLNDQVKYMKNNIIYALKEQKSLKELWGYEPERGIIFHGPPGTGKTLLAKAFAAEVSTGDSKMTFFMRKGTDCFSKWIGETEKNIRELFAKAKEMKPSIIFFDELDGLCPNRNADHLHQIYTSVVTTLLGEIDNVKRGEVFLIGATNRLESIDPAIRRPGRLGKELAFHPPNEEGRLQILNIHLAKWHRKPKKEDFTFIAKHTSGYTGADLEQLCRHAFNCARERLTEGRATCNCNLQNMEVLHQDWEVAINTTKRSNSNVFGNALFIGQDLPSEMKPLLGGIQCEFEEHLKQLYPEGSTHSKETELGRKLLHLWTNNESDLEILNCHIIPSLLTAIDPGQVPAFHLSIPSLATCRNPVVHVNELFNQINSCFKNTVVLFMPRVDTFWTRLVHAQPVRDAFEQHLESARCKRIILLTTATTDLPAVACGIKWMKSIESSQDSCHQLRAPTANEIKAFFRPLLHQDAKYFRGENKAASCSTASKLNEMLLDAVNMVKEKSISAMFSLQGDLALLCNKSDSSTNGSPSAADIKCLITKLDETLADFEDKNN